METRICANLYESTRIFRFIRVNSRRFAVPSERTCVTRIGIVGSARCHFGEGAADLDEVQYVLAVAGAEGLGDGKGAEKFVRVLAVKRQSIWRLQNGLTSESSFRTVRSGVCDAIKSIAEILSWQAEDFGDAIHRNWRQVRSPFEITNSAAWQKPCPFFLDPLKYFGCSRIIIS
ncbi:MAG: hypothetical protein IT331_02955 [Anaerolineae bacterium]|nr:hypothetical protein [Anaerolineae bacterium]